MKAVIIVIYPSLVFCPFDVYITKRRRILFFDKIDLFFFLQTSFKLFDEIVWSLSKSLNGLENYAIYAIQEKIRQMISRRVNSNFRIESIKQVIKHSYTLELQVINLKTTYTWLVE